MKTCSLVRAVAPVLLACGLGALSITAQAQTAFPTKPITIVVPFAAGGTTDVLARALQAPLQKILGQPVIVDNKTGAAGVIAARFVKNSAPDGHTLLMPNNGYLIAPLTSKDAGYDPLKSFTPVVLLSKQPMILAINPSVPANNVPELIAYAKANPKAVAFSNSGPMSLSHLATELFAQKAGIEVLNVPYKGQGPAFMAVLSGEAKGLVNTSSSQMTGAAQAGKVRLIGVTSLQPTSLAPGLTPVANTLPGYSVEVWFGFVAPEGTPREVVARLNAAVNQALNLPEVREKYSGTGAQVSGGTVENLSQLINEEYASWKDVFKKAGIAPQ